MLGSGVAAALIGASSAMTHLAYAMSSSSNCNRHSRFVRPLPMFSGVRKHSHAHAIFPTALATRTPSQSKGGTPGKSSLGANAEFLLRVSAGEVGADELQRALLAGKIPQGRRSWEWALAFVSGVYDSGAQPEASAMTIAIEACGRASRWEPALKFLADLQKAGHVPDEGAFDAVMRACDRSGEWEWSLELLREMTALEQEPNAHVYGAVVSACDRAGQSVRALKLLNEMCERGLEPELVTFSLAVGSCKKKLQELSERAVRKSKETKQRVSPSKPRPPQKRKTLML